MNGISEINWRCVGWAARSRGQYNSGSPFSSLFFFNSFLWEWKELIEEKEELTGSAAGSVIWRNLIELVKSNWIQWSCRVELDEMDWGCCFWVGYGPAPRPMAPPKEANQPSQSINSNSTKQFIKSEVKINQLEFLFFAAVDEINKAKERNGLIDWTSGAPSSPAARQANNSTNQMLAFQLGPHLMVVLAELLLFHPAQLKNEIELVMGRRPLYRAPFHSSNSWIAFISAACSFSWRMKEKTSELEWVD